MNIAVIQARMGSSRLPGKVMKEIVGKPMIGLLLERLSRSKKIDKLVLATSVSASDDRLSEYVQSLGVDVFRGSENDVLDRFYQAVKNQKPDAIVRVTADSPLQDPVLIDEVLDFFYSGGFDYVSSGANAPSFPDGMDTEIFSFSALERAWKEASLLSEREHVTPYIKKSGCFKLGDYHPDRDYSQERLVVDNEEDLPVVRAIFEKFYEANPGFGLKDILEFKQQNPEAFKSNQNIEKNEGYKKSLVRDRTVSFDPEEKGNYLEESIGPENFYPLYNEFYQSLASFLDAQSKSSKLEYRGVHLLWCFKKSLFESGNYAVQRHEAMRRLLLENPAGFSVAEPDPFPEPDLSKIIGMGDLGAHPGIKRFIKKNAPPDSSVTAKAWSLKGLFPGRFSWGAIAPRKVVIFSDLRKAVNIIEHLSAGEAVFYTDSRAPKIWLKMIKMRHSFYQASYPAKGIASYRQKAVGFVSAFQKEKPFESYRFKGIRGSDLMNGPAETLLIKHLEKLIFDIDQAHLFFSESKNLRAAVLDEDISPVKNAFCQVARQYRIKTAVESHGLINVPCGFVPLVADNLFVWVEPMKKKLVRWGCPADRVVVTGCSFHERVRAIDKAAAKRKIADDFKLVNGLPIAVAALHPLNTWTKYYFFKNIIQATNGEILKAIIASPEIQWIIKLHPDDTEKGFYDRWVAENRLETRVRVVKAYDSLLLARGCDFLVVYLSTFAVDGVAMENNVISVQDRLAVSAEDDLKEYRLYYEARNAEEIALKAKKLSLGNVKRIGNYHAAENDGLRVVNPGPAERIITHLLNKE